MKIGYNRFYLPRFSHTHTRFIIHLKHNIYKKYILLVLLDFNSLFVDVFISLIFVSVYYIPAFNLISNINVSLH